MKKIIINHLFRFLGVQLTSTLITHLNFLRQSLNKNDLSVSSRFLNFQFLRLVFSSLSIWEVYHIVMGQIILSSSFLRLVSFLDFLVTLVISLVTLLNLAFCSIFSRFKHFFWFFLFVVDAMFCDPRPLWLYNIQYNDDGWYFVKLSNQNKSFLRKSM
jgi:hypothetical protein